MKERKKHRKKHYHKKDPYSVPNIALSIDDTIGILSDTHFGSKYAAYGKLHEFYDHAHDMGIRQVFHAGDITDGNLSYYLDDVEIRGFKKQVDKVIKDYPRRKGIETHVIMGNHDSRYLRTNSVDILSMISAARPDIKNHGKSFARFSDKNKNIKLELHHPRSLKTYGNSYDITYGAECYLSSIPPVQRPDILVRGHMHQNWFGKVLGSFVFEAGCFINPSEHLIEMGYENTVGGWFAEIKDGNRRITSVKTEWFQGNNLKEKNGNLQKFRKNT